MIDSRAVFVIPAHNEAGTVGEVVRRASALGAAVAVVVVDDGSTDGTAEAAGRAGARVAVHETNLGQGAAIQTGIELALALGATHVVTCDADGQHRPEDAAPMIERLAREGLDVVLGTRLGLRSEGMPLERHLLLRAGLLFTRLTTGMRLTDTHNGLRVFRAGAAGRLGLTQDRMAHASQILERISREGMRWAEEPVRVTYTVYSRGKGQTSLGAARILLDLLREKLGLAGDRERTERVRRRAIERALAENPPPDPSPRGKG
jgi:glycosyltransferase involved in cell wall biosynthesis